MNEQTNKLSAQSDSWNTYWQGTGDTGAFASGGASHPVIREFWVTFFQSVQQDYKQPAIIDLASGNGAVLECILEEYAGQAIALTSLDLSTAAIANIKRRFPAVNGIVADAAEIPLESGSFDIVTSQFGVEYAGQEAILEAARLVSDGGQLALLVHADSGSIHEECLQSLDATKRTQSCNFIPAAINMFDTGFKAVRGADRTAYDEAAKNLAPAIAELESIMRQYGPHVAGDTVSRLYNDVSQIHQRIQHYEPADVLGWLNKMDTELKAYAERMASMSQAAIDSTGFEQLKTHLENMAFSIQRAEALTIPGQERPMAWILIAEK